MTLERTHCPYANRKENYLCASNIVLFRSHMIPAVNLLRQKRQVEERYLHRIQ